MVNPDGLLKPPPPPRLAAPDAEQITLASGLPAYLVSVPAQEAYSDKLHKPDHQWKGQQQELAKLHTRDALAAHPQRAQHAQQGAAATALVKSTGDKKRD